MHTIKQKHSFLHTIYCLWSFLGCFSPAVANIIFYCLPGFAEFLPGLARRERGSKGEAGGGHGQGYTVGGGSDWSHTEGSTKGNGAGQVSSGWR